jgi:hypothetical protein
MERPAYDTKEGIAASLDSYEQLYALFRERHRAGYERHERLQEFVILGRFSADALGNWWTMRFERPLPPTFAAALPPVMSPTEFHAALAQLGRDGILYSAGSSTGPLGSLPPPQMTCAHCGLAGWTVENCHESEADSGFDDDSLSLEPYVGKTLTEVQAALDSRTDGIYTLYATVRNDRWIEPEGRLGREEGWRSHQDETDPIGMDHVAVPGDEASVYVLRFYHAVCRGQIRKDERTAARSDAVEAFKEMFSETGFGNVRVEGVALPQHILDWMRQEEDGDDLEDAREELTYLKVESDEGTVGVFLAAYPTLDLTDSGVSLAELMPEMEALPQGTPQIVGFDGNPATLLNLRQLMLKRRTSQRD